MIQANKYNQNKHQNIVKIKHNKYDSHDNTI